MDKNTVFVKTREGEEAVRQRTRLVQRNLRNILIMVDGNASAADLAKRFGDENAAQAALAELLNGGLIVEAANRLDFTSPQPAETIGEKDEEVPLLTTQIASRPSIEAAAEPSTEPPSEPASRPPTLIEEIILSAPEYESLPPAAFRRAEQPNPPAVAVAAEPGWVRRIKSLFAPRGAATPSGTDRLEPGESAGRGVRLIDPAPRERAAGLSISWPLLVPVAVFGMAALLALGVAFYPYSRHLPDIERHASARLQDPVKIGDIGFSFLPRPHIALRNITVGREAHLTIATVRAVPDFFSLLGNRKLFHEVAFENVGVKGQDIGRLALAGAGGGDAVKIRRVTLTGLNVTFADASLGGIGGEIILSEQGVPEKILLHNADDTLKLEMQPQGEGYRIAVSGSGWKTPFTPALTFQSIDAQGDLRASRLDLGRVEGRAYEGLVAGKATLDWASGAALSGDLELKHLSAAKLLSALGSDLSVDGELDSRLRLDAKADSLGKLPEALRVDGTFEMKRGTATGFDLGEAVRNTGRTPTRGGETKFEQLSGAFQGDPRSYRLNNLKLVSGLLQANGNLGLTRDGQLGGALNVELRSSAMTMRMPLAIGGKAKDPLLTPTRLR